MKTKHVFPPPIKSGTQHGIFLTVEFCGIPILQANGQTDKPLFIQK